MVCSLLLAFGCAKEDDSETTTTTGSSTPTSCSEVKEPTTITLGGSVQCDMDDTTAPTVSLVCPAEGSTDVSVDTGLSVTFSKEMNSNLISSLNNSNACTGSIQVSSDNFSTCANITSQAAYDLKTFFLEISDNLSFNTNYKVKVKTDAKDYCNSTPIASEYITSSGFTTIADNSSSSNIIPTGSVLFSSQYSAASSGSDDTLKAVSREGGYVKVGSGGNFTYGFYQLDTDALMQERQAYGIQWRHSGTDENSTATTPDGNSFVYLSFGAPDNGSVNVSNSDNIIIQMGNGAADNQTNTHKVFTVEVNGGSATGSWPAWTNSCYYDQTLDNNSLLGQTGSNSYGLRTYEIPLSSFTCYSGAGSVSSLKDNVSEVIVKVVGGKDSNADNSTSLNYTFPTIGFIGFND